MSFTPSRNYMSEIEWIDMVSANLMEILQERGITQYELADDAGISESVISKFLNRKTMPSLKTIINIAYALDIDLDELANPLDCRIV